MATVHFWPPAAHDQDDLRAGSPPPHTHPEESLTLQGAHYPCPGIVVPSCAMTSQAWPCPPMGPGTLGRKEVDEDGDGGHEHAGGDDVDDVEEGLALDEQVENHFLVARLLCWRHSVQ